MIKIGVVNPYESPACSFLYVYPGETTDQVWIDRIRDLPAPWAELEAPGMLGLAVPSAAIRDLSNPEELMQFWHDQMVVANNFAGFPNGERERMERVAFDIQISAGKDFFKMKPSDNVLW